MMIVGVTMYQQHGGRTRCRSVESERHRPQGARRAHRFEWRLEFAGVDGLQQWKEAAAPAEHGEHDLGAEGGRAGAPVGKEQRRGLRLSEGTDGRDGSALDFMWLFHFEQAGECGVDAVEWK